jgi:hypothetical protein
MSKAVSLSTYASRFVPLLTIPLRVRFALLLKFCALGFVDIGDIWGSKQWKTHQWSDLVKTLTIPLRCRFAVLDFPSLNRGGTGKASGKPEDSRDGGNTHVEYQEVYCVKRREG